MAGSGLAAGAAQPDGPTCGLLHFLDVAARWTCSTLTRRIYNSRRLQGVAGRHRPDGAADSLQGGGDLLCYPDPEGCARRRTRTAGSRGAASASALIRPTTPRLARPSLPFPSHTTTWLRHCSSHWRGHRYCDGSRWGADARGLDSNAGPGVADGADAGGGAATGDRSIGVDGGTGGRSIATQRTRSWLGNCRRGRGGRARATGEGG